MSAITFRSIGRLGNFLFQAAACCGYAKKHGVKWLCPTDTQENPNVYKWFPNLPVGDVGGERYEAHDPSMFDYHEIPYHPNGVKLVGFFQSEKYFKHAEAEVREVFKLKDYPEMAEYCSIHIRLGDYVTYANSFPPVTADYLRMAVAKFPSDQKFLVFSDEITKAREMVRTFFPNQNHRFFYGEGEDEYIDLSAMASCSHNIIANSTFSWWAAWLNKNPNKRVISPHHTSWFGSNGPKKTQDLIPDEWEQIKFR